MGAKKCEENVCITLPFSIIGTQSNVALVDLVAEVTSVFCRIRGCPVLTVVWRWTTSVKQVVLAVIDYEEVRPAVIVEIEETDL